MAERAREQKEQRETAGERTPARREATSAPAPTPARGSPFGFMRRFVEDMDRIFEDFGFGTAFSPRIELGSRGWAGAGWAPQMDVLERGNELVIRADLPGLKREDISVEVRDDAVCVSGERRQEEEQREGGVYRRERSYGSFCRTIALPEGVDAQQAKASFSDGVLEITVPLPERRAARRIEIQEGGGTGRAPSARSA